MKVLVTGGLGYIGSHICVELVENNMEVVVVDNLSNSKKQVRDLIEQICGKKIKLYVFDVANNKKLENVFRKEKIDAVIHCAGYKAVGESVKKPLMYFENNLGTTLNLLKVMEKYSCNKLLFSSSATVYGASNQMPLCETSPVGGVTNPYGRTKLMIEQILEDYSKANPNFKTILLRYFNPIGAHSSGLIGENPNRIPNNLMPYISKVACGKLEQLSIFGNDYETHDGTGVRDYIHVVDLANGHVKAIEFFDKMQTALEVFNLGTGTGYSVLDVVNAYNKVCGNKVKYKIAPRRDGDAAVCYCSPNKANTMLGWSAKHTLDDMCKSSYLFENNLKK
ncbi:MAG: UDP-glucose 4-epimerase GalE [Clostridia bacterium]|nr:UDP-glucose 4-epimerase GalE [Clostridia bacterium]